MLISKDWSILRVTLLLYLLVVLFPVNIYLANHILADTKQDTQTISALKRISGQMQDVTLDTGNVDKEVLHQIDQYMQSISEEFMSSDANKFDVGFENVQVEFSLLQGCWSDFKSQLLKGPGSPLLFEKNAACQKRVMKLVVLVNKMANIKREESLLWLNIVLIVTMIIMVVTIYYVRVTMKKRLERHTIYDVQTRLFNRDYFDAEIQKACALAARKQHPLALIAIAIDNFESTIQTLEPKQYEAVMKNIGGLLLSMMRTSDTSCRYTQGEFMIITPETALKDALLVAQRIHKRIIEHDFGIQHPMTVSISVALQHEHEEVANLVKRSVQTLHEAKEQGNRIETADVKR